MFLNPLAWFLFLLALPIIAFFLLKTQPRQIIVSTAIFWQQVFEENRTRRLWRKLRYPLSLFLALLFLTLLCFAVLNPVWNQSKLPARCVIIIDNSGSMNALLNHRINNQSSHSAKRLDAAKQKAKQHLNGALTAIITAGGTPGIAAGFTDHQGTLRKTIDSIQATNQRTALNESIQLAQELIADSRDSMILVFTDGCTPLTEKNVTGNNAVDTKNYHLKIITIGEPADNVAITAFQTRRSFNAPSGYEIFAEVTNFGRQPVSCRLEIEQQSENGWLPIDVFPVELAQNKTLTKMISGTENGKMIVRASLTGHRDVLPDDDTAFTELPALQTLNVFFYGADNFFLTQVLNALPNVNVQHIKNLPQEFPRELSANDILLFHQSVPKTLPTGNVVILDPRQSCDLFQVAGNIEQPIVDDTPLPNTFQQVLTNVSFKNTVLVGAKRLALFQPKKSSAASEKEIAKTEKTQIILQTPEGQPLFFRNAKTFVLTLDLNRGDFALKTAFPILMSNILSTFRQESGIMIAGVAFCKDESDLSKTGGDLPKATDNEMPVRAVSLTRYPIWFYLTVAALILSTLEWCLYQRRKIE